MEPACEFKGVVIPSGKQIPVEPEIDEDTFETYHFTNVALGSKPAKGPHTIFVTNEDGTFAIGTLDKERCTQFTVDLTLCGAGVILSHTGDSDVFLTGYSTVGIMGFEGDEDDDDEEYEYDEDMLIAPRAVDSDEEDSEEDEDDSSEEEDEDEEAPAAVPLSAKKENGNGKKPVTTAMLIEEQAIEEDESDDDYEDSEEGGEDEEDDDEDEEEEERQPSEQKKRKGKDEQQAFRTPQPAKKPKLEGEGKVAPASAPATDKDYIKALESFLRENGPQKLSILGSQVKKPSKSAKLKSILAQNKETFTYNPATDAVALV